MWDRFWRWVPNTIDSDHLVKKRGTEWNKPLALAYFLYRCQIWTFQEKYNNFEKKFTKIDKKLVSQSILEVGHFISKKMVFFQNLICIGNPTVNLIYYVPLFFYQMVRIGTQVQNRSHICVSQRSGGKIPHWYSEYVTEINHLTVRTDLLHGIHVVRGGQMQY